MRKVVLGLIGALLILAGGGACVAGALVGGVFGRDGVVRSEPIRVTADVAALTTDVVQIDAGLPRTEGIAAVELSARAVDGGRVFVGIGRADRVRTYLAGTPYAVVSGIDGSPGSDAGVSLRIIDGSDRPTPPAAEDFWVASAVGSNQQRLQWSPEPGRFVAVIMTADASIPVDAQVSAGLSVPWAFPVAIAVVVAGLILVALGAIALFLGFRRTHQPLQIITTDSENLPTAPPRSDVAGEASPKTTQQRQFGSVPIEAVSTAAVPDDQAVTADGPQRPPREPDQP